MPGGRGRCPHLVEVAVLRCCIGISLGTALSGSRDKRSAPLNALTRRQRLQVHATVWRMDHAWGAQQLKEFQRNIDDFYRLSSYEIGEYTSDQEVDDYQSLMEAYRSLQGAIDRLITLDPVMRSIMNAAQAGLGDYFEPGDEGWTYDGSYWRDIVKPRVLRATGIHEFGEEAQRRMRPDSPDLTADQFHPWVWEAAAPLWYAGSRQEAVHAAARSVNARMQQKRGHHDKSDAALCREFFSFDKPAPGRPRLRFGGYTPTDLTWRSKQQGAMEFGAGCFEGIRNPAAHQHGLILTEQVALEQLAAFSLLARWVDECEVQTASVQG